MSGEEAPGAGAPSPAQEPAAGPTRGDRWILAGFGLYVFVLLVGAWAQLTDNRAVLDWFDLHRWFTK